MERLIDFGKKAALVGGAAWTVKSLGTNVGIEEEMGILTPGLIWLALGAFLTVATRSKEVSTS